MPLLGSFTSQLFTATAKIAVTGGVSLLHTLTNPNAFGTSADDGFGRIVAISDNYAIVGASGEDDAGGISSGKVYIYNVTTGALVHTLDNPNAFGTSASDFFSISVAISGNYAIVGASDEDDAGGTISGKAYIFNVTTGALIHTLNNPNAFGTSANDGFGADVAISDNYAIVGASGEDDAGGISSGKVYIYNVTTGALLYTLNNPSGNSTDSDFFGSSVAISGNYAIIGAFLEDNASDLSLGTGQGKAYIYNVTTGDLVYRIDNPNAYGFTRSNDQFGNQVAISGNYAIVGAYQEDDAGDNNSGNNSGKAYIYDVTTSVRVHTLNNPNAYGTANTDRFGWSVAISGNYAIVGTYQEDDVGVVNSGRAYIYNVTSGALMHTLNNPNAYSTPDNDQFGYSVAISGNYAIVGAYQEDDAGGTSSGKVYIYQLG